MTSSLFSPKWKAPHTMMDGTTLPSVCCTQASIYISPSRLRTKIRPLLRYSFKWDSSEKTQCLQWWRCQSQCFRAHCLRLRRCCPFSLGHLVGLRERYPSVKSRRLMVRTEIRRPIWRVNSTLHQGLEWNRLKHIIIWRTWAPSQYKDHILDKTVPSDGCR